MPRKVTEDNKSEYKMLKKLLKQGLSSVEIAEEVGWSERTVWKRLDFHGLTKRSKKREYCGSCGHALMREEEVADVS